MLRNIHQAYHLCQGFSLRVTPLAWLFIPILAPALLFMFFQRLQGYTLVERRCILVYLVNKEGQRQNRENRLIVITSPVTVCRPN
jgi:hypothetical protein